MASPRPQDAGDPEGGDPAGTDSLRVLMVAPQPFFRPRGTPFSVLHRIRAICEMGHRVDLVTYPFGQDVVIPGLTIHRAPRPLGVQDVGIGPSLAKIFLDWKLYRFTVRMLARESFDLLHTHEEAAFFGVGLARKHGIPHIYDMHSSLPQQLSNFQKFNLAPFVWLFNKLERRTLTTCDGVITVCPDLEVRVDEEQLTVPSSMIENFADDTKVFPPRPREVRADLGLEGKTILLYTGTFEGYQGLDLLLESLARVSSDLPDAHLVLVGGRPAQVEEYKEMARSLGLEDVTTFVGQVQPDEIPPFIEACDVLVSPRSRGTNTPLKIYSYLRSGRPLLATDLETHRQVLDDEISLLVPAEVEGFASGLKRIVADASLRERIVAAALRHADGRFTDEVYLDRVQSFYAEVTSRNGR